MFWFFVLAVIGLVILVSHSDKKTKAASDVRAQALNQQWIDFIAGYGRVVHDPEQKALVARMLSDIANQNLGGPSFSVVNMEDAVPGMTAEKATITPAAVAAEIARQKHAETAVAVQSVAAREKAAAAKVQLDNTSLLLYFGAFLFVASVGLFVGLGKAGGTLRTLAVLVVLFVMYGSGVWLYRNRPKLQQAGLAFAGIGVVIAPLFGAAVYNYITGQKHGAFVWLLTSVLCMGLYAHALVTFKKPLISYLLIFTFLSLFESGINVVDAPVYYLIWGMALVGILLQIVNRVKGYWPELQESSRMSARVLLPLSLLVSVVVIAQQGVVQLGITLLLAAAFYVLEALSATGEEQEIDALVAHVLVLTGVSALTYGVTHHWSAVAVCLLVAGAVQMVVLLQAKTVSNLWRNYGSVLLVSALAAIAFSWGHPKYLLASVGATVVVGAFVWWKQRRADAYAVAALSWAAMPYVYGQFVAQPHFAAAAQAWWASVALLVLPLAYVLQKRSAGKVAGWSNTVAATYITAAAAAVVTSIMATGPVCIGVTAVVVATLVLLAEHDKNTEWAECAALFLAAPLLRTADDKVLFLATTAGCLLVLVALSLRYRKEMLRWASTFVWLLLPMAIVRSVSIQIDASVLYTYGYVLAMLGLVLSRSIARGVVFVSSKIPLTAYARTASLSYVVGYWVAAALAILLSLFVNDGRVHTSIVLAVMLATTYVLSRWIEKRKDLLALQPFFAQALFLSLLRPAQHGTSLYVYVLGSSALAVFSYFAARLIQDKNSKDKGQFAVVTVSVITAFVAPATILYASNSIWAMPLGLLVAGGVLLHHLWFSSQANRELVGGIVPLSLMWFLGVFHVEALQAYVHVLVATFGAYAYWRATRHETKESDNYLWAMLFVATVPLALQALGGSGGGLYGWWLLLEQVAIMLLGITINKSFVTRWGLYVSLAAVLYQLRGLGYAALAVLALFLIGLAVYRLQKHDQDK